MTAAAGPARRGAAVLGSPISHSLSPVLHRAAYDALGLADWTYRAIECISDRLHDTLRGLDTERLAGVSLTMPLKRTVVPMLATVDTVAATVGAANTVIFRDDGWHGANTDVLGMVAALRPHLSGTQAGSRAAILGAGATAASAIAAAANLGFSGVAVFARRPSAARELEGLAANLDLGVDVLGWEHLATAADHPLVIATTPADSTQALATAIAATPGLLFDVIYSPWPTPLAAAWQAGGGRVVGGLELLTEQAALQVHLMTGLPASVDVMREAGYAALH